MTLTEIAGQISEHLARFEADPKINPSVKFDREKSKWVKAEGGLRHYSGANARRGGSRVMITYVSYQGSDGLTRAEALRYLEWLDAGNVGKHGRVK